MMNKTTTQLYYMPSNVIREPVCDLETAVGLRLTAAEETVAFADENLLQIPSTTNQPQETGKVVSFKDPVI